MELHYVRDLVPVVQRLLVRDVELDGDAEVAAEDDDGRYGEVEGEHGDDEGEALVLHLPPGERAGQAEGLRAVAAPAQQGEQSPEQRVDPRTQAQQLHLPQADLLPCRDEERRRWNYSLRI